MIPKAYINEWRQNAPWQQNAQVEQDLIISRSLIELFSNNELSEHLAFRGGTALHKLHLSPQARYSEDIDLVQVKEGPIKPILEAMSRSLSFLGGKQDRKIKSSDHNWTVFYYFEPEDPPPFKMRIKFEINTREHHPVYPLVKESLIIDNRWFSGESQITTYTLEELLATKLRALYQRSKGRDIFDLYYALTHLDPDLHIIIKCFRQYLKMEDLSSPSPKEMKLNIDSKMGDSEFIGDISDILRPGIEFNIHKAKELVMDALTTKL